MLHSCFGVILMCKYHLLYVVHRSMNLYYILLVVSQKLMHIWVKETLDLDLTSSLVYNKISQI